MIERHLVLVTNPRANRRSDFEAIAREVRARDPTVRSYVVPDRSCPLRRRWMARRPTLVFSPGPLARFRPPRGAVFQGVPVMKSIEHRALAQAGIPVPKWTLLAAEGGSDLSEFGPYVVVKPNDGGRGADVRIVRRSRAGWRAPVARWRPRVVPAGDPVDALVAQEFIYTGPWPSSYRVVTLFGEALMSFRVEASHARPPLLGRYEFQGDGVSIVSAGRDCTWGLDADDEVVRLAERSHAAFPDVPLLGVDVIREQPSGRLYVLEVNAGGWTWHFSTPTSLQIQKQFGLDPYAQMGGLAKAARILAEQTRRRAT